MDEIKQKTIDEFESAVSAKEFARIKRELRSFSSVDIADILMGLDVEPCTTLFRLVSRKKRAEVFPYLEYDRQVSLLGLLSDLTIYSLLNDLGPVDRTKLLEELPDETRSRLIEMLSPKEREITDLILSYPEGSVGRLMSPEFISLRSGITASMGLDQVRWSASQYPQNLIYYVFIVDQDRHYLGQVGIASLIAADPPRQLVDELIDNTQPALSVLAPEQEAVDFFRKYDQPLMPVIDENNILVGVVESDDVFDLAEEEATEDIQQFGGHGPLEDSYFQTSLWQLVRKRAGWLALLFAVGMLFTTNALEHFDKEIKLWSFLVVFLPLIISSGGNSGSQAASLMIRGLAVREIEISDWWRVLKRELVVGCLLGLILGAMGFFRAVVGGSSIQVGYIVCIALIGIVVFGALIGAMLPFFLMGIRLDPAVSSSPVIASLVDIFGIIIFFEIAIFMMAG